MEHSRSATDPPVEGSTLQPLLLNVAQAAALLNVGTTTLYKLIGTGELPSTRIHGRRLMKYCAIERFVDELMSESP